MKFILVFSFLLTMMCSAHANKSGEGQEMDPIGGDQSRCCATGKCSELKACSDIEFGGRSTITKDPSKTKSSSSKKTKANDA